MKRLTNLTKTNVTESTENAIQSAASVMSMSEKLKQKYFDRLEKNRKYNESILEEIPENLQKAQLLDGNIIVKLLKFEGVRNNEGLFIEPKYRPYELSNGQKAADVDRFEYSSRAVVIKKPSEEYVKALSSPLRELMYNNLKEKQSIVWLNTIQLQNQPAFTVDRSYPANADEFNGYLSIPITSIQLIEHE